MFLALLGCKNDNDVKIINYTITACNGEESYDVLNSSKNRIKNYKFKEENFEIEVFFVEECGFVIDPKVTVDQNVLLIDVDQFQKDSNRLYALCRCCYGLRITIAGLEEIDPDQLIYKLQLSDKYPERIYRTDSIFHTYNIDFTIVEDDTIYYPQTESSYTRREFVGYSKSDSASIYASFPDQADIEFKRYNPVTGTVLRLYNGRYERINAEAQIIDKGWLEYKFTEEGNGVEIVFKKQ